MLLVGLTGGIATGKSTVARLFAERGAAVVDADRLTHRLQAPGTPCHAAIATAFGSGVVAPTGELDRAALAARVFADPGLRRRLEAIMHPATWIAARAEAQAAAAAGSALCLIDAALLFEAGWASRCDAVIVITAPASVQLARLRARGLDEGAARLRLAAQWPVAHKAARADFTIDGGGSLAITVAQVAQVHAALVARAR